MNLIDIKLTHKSIFGGSNNTMQCNDNNTLVTLVYKYIHQPTD